MNGRNILVVALSLGLVSSNEVAGSEYGDPRRECWVIADQMERVCAVTFAELINSPDKFNGKYIKITGFALDNQNFTYLFPSKDAYIYGAARGGIDLLIDESMRSNFNVASGHSGAVTVIGKFNAMRGRLPGSVGVISGPGLKFYIENFPWEAPLLPDKKIDN